jgi:xanthine/CO dehydrogenase XdhC/CoxF family maturation factor
MKNKKLKSKEEFLRAVASGSERGEVFLATLIWTEGGIAKILLSATGDVLAVNSSSELLFEKVVERLKVICLDIISSGVNLVSGDIDSSARFVIEAIRPRASILVLGAGHVGRALALIASISGYAVKVVDDRAEFLTRERFPDDSIELVPMAFDKISEQIKITSSTSIVIVTRGHQHDEVCLQQVINSDANYIGMIGSKRRVIGIFRRLADQGFSWDQLRKVHAPIGLDIGAVSPQEIAVSILAEVIQVTRKPASQKSKELRFGGK